jgi:hypothetical protein
VTGVDVAAGWRRFWFPAVPAERLAVFSRIVNLVVLWTVFRADAFVADKAWAPVEYYQPVWLARTSGLPAPTETTMWLLRVVILVSAVAAIAGVGPRRLVNGVVATSYLLFFLWAFSYAKVDHDQLTILVALFVLTAVPGTGRGQDPVAGWALRTVQVVFVLAYPLSAISKLRASGVGWMSSAVFARAIVRRGSPIGDWFADRPSLLVTGQWAFITFEFLAVFALVHQRAVRAAVLVGIVLLHVFTWLTIGIHFLPHTICITAFLPLERLHPSWWRSRSDRDAGDRVQV